MDRFASIVGDMPETRSSPEEVKNIRIENCIGFSKGVSTHPSQPTSTHVKLLKMQPAVIGSQVHVLCTYTCGDAAGQNMVTKATQYACDMVRKTYGDKFHITDFFIEGQMASDKKPSWSHVQTPRGVQVMAWGTISAEACKTVFGCTTRRLYQAQRTLKEGGIRNGQFGSNINTANIVAAIFIATGQDPASIVDAAWCHLTSELDESTDALTMSMFCPSLPIGVIGGGTGYPTQREALRLLGCDGTNERHRLAGIIASFSLALDASTSAAIANNTFTKSHMVLARGEEKSKL